MTKIAFRQLSPKRNCTRNFTKYQFFKPYLQADFNERCGYTDCRDKWFGGITTFHIDHFVPLKRDPTLRTTYGNLVYSCSYVNILKSDDDPAHYLDPCDEEYNDHFYRDELGAIFPEPTSQKAKYMHRKLKLGLARYQVIWLIDKLYDCMSDLQKIAANLPNGSSEEQEVKNLYFQLGGEFQKHLDYLTQP